jgi:hypothetical protein
MLDSVEKALTEVDRRLEPVINFVRLF